MRLLIISRVYPFPADNGAKRRIGAFLTELSCRHEVTFIAMHEQPVNGSTPKGWREYVYPLHKAKGVAVMLHSLLSGKTYHEARFWSSEFQQAVSKLLLEQQFDAVLVVTLTNSTFLEPYLDQATTAGNHPAAGNRRPLLLVDPLNVDHQVWEWHLRGSKSLWRTAYVRWQLAKYLRYERRWYPRYDVVLAVSAEDLEGTRPFLGEQTDIWLTPNGVDTSYFMPTERRQQPVPTLVYLGSMDVTMNQEAVKWFAARVLPQIQQVIPETRFLIVGRDPSPDVLALGENPSITVTGTVPDVRDYYRQADVAVVPAVQGGGTKLKTLEAMAMAMPIVSTAVGVQGLEAIDGKHFLLADQPAEFARQVVALLQNSQQAAALGREAREMVCRHYDWQPIVAAVETKLMTLAQNKRP